MQNSYCELTSWSKSAKLLLSRATTGEQRKNRRRKGGIWLISVLDIYYRCGTKFYFEFTIWPFNVVCFPFICSLVFPLSFDLTTIGNEQYVLNSKVVHSACGLCRTNVCQIHTPPIHSDTGKFYAYFLQHF